MDSNLVFQVGTLAAIIATAAIAWFREGRMRAWAQADAAQLAEKLRNETTALAQKVSTDAAQVLAKNTTDAAALAKNLLDDATKVSEKLNVAAEKMIESIKKNTEVSNIALQGSQVAYTEANTVNNKIAKLNSQMAAIMKHIKAKK